MNKFAQLTTTAIICLSVAGCTTNKVTALEALDEHVPLVYKVEVPQGNIITTEMDRQIKTGMTQDQVRALMGTPLIVQLFNQNRWDYYYLLRPGRGKPLQHHMVVLFDSDKKVTEVQHAEETKSAIPEPAEENWQPLT